MATDQDTTARSAPLRPVLTELSPLIDIVAAKMALRLATRIHGAYGSPAAPTRNTVFAAIYEALRTAHRR